MHNTHIKWTWFNFSELSTPQLYALLKLRQDVFILEQASFYHDMDGLDPVATHLCAFERDELVACLRLLPKAEDYIHFGRVAVKKSYRGQGLGHCIMKELLRYLKQHNMQDPIKISAQLYLQSFYSTYHFKAVGLPFDEEGVEHITMVRELGRVEA